MPPKPPRKVDLSTRPPHLRAGSSTSTSGAVSKVASDGIPVSADREQPDLSASSYDDASPLHFHGLAVTQTQTQVASCAEQSGKGSEMSESRVIKRRKVCHDADAPLSSELPPKALNGASGTKLTSRPPSKLKRRRSPSIDSFAEAEEWEDPAKSFLATNPKFEIPLSELGRGTTQEDYQKDEGPVAARSPPAAVLRDPTQTDLPSSPGRPPDSGSRHKRRIRRPGAQGDDVLSQVSNVSLGAPGQNDTFENETHDVPDNASTPPLVSNPGSMDHMDTQVEDYQSTQPLASEDLDADTTQVFDGGVPHVGQSSPQEYTSMNSRPSSNTRNILGMVNPMKKWRHQQGQLLQQHAATDCIVDGQTQPSAEFSHVPSTGRRLYEQLAAQLCAEPQPSGQNDHNHLSLPAIDEDSRETAVVPDSEPADASSSSSRPDLSNPPDVSLPESPPPQPVVRHKIPQPGEETGAYTDDDEDDVPLMLTAGHQAPRVVPLVENAGDLPKAKSSRTRGRSERAPKIKVTKTRGTDAGDKEIPSSVPERDHRSSLVPSRLPTSPRSSSRRKGKRRDDPVEDMPIPDPPPDVVTFTPDKDTDSAEDLPLEAEDDVPIPRELKVQLPPNRRRLPMVPIRKAGFRSAPREASKTPSFASASRATKRTKSHHPTATRVFALWKQEAAYYAGIVCERVGSLDRFKIQFDDGDEDVVDVKNLRRLELRVGDRVSVIESQEKATVVNVDGQIYDTVVVQTTDEPTDENVVDVIGIKIQSRAIKAQWEDRTIHSDEIVTLVPPTKSETPSSLRNPSTGLNKKKALAKVGIVVTLSAGSYREKERESIMRNIRNIGGTVLDDWSDIVSLAGEYSSNKKRWVITSDSIGTETKLDVQQVFLISDAANAKPRYLTALALGIPCVSLTWLEDMSSGQCTVLDWPTYLLSAGYSDSLGARVTQMVDLDWGTTLDHLTGIMSNKVPTKLFSNMSILVLGQEYFPPPAKGKKGTSGVGDEKSNDSARFIPRIIASMGAARVEAVPELKYASNPDLKGFQYVVVKELHEQPPVGGEKYVSMEWVKDCLIAGRMFPPRG